MAAGKQFNEERIAAAGDTQWTWVPDKKNGGILGYDRIYHPKTAPVAQRFFYEHGMTNTPTTHHYDEGDYVRIRGTPEQIKNFEAWAEKFPDMPVEKKPEAAPPGRWADSVRASPPGAPRTLFDL